MLNYYVEIARMLKPVVNLGQYANFTKVVRVEIPELYGKFLELTEEDEWNPNED